MKNPHHGYVILLVEWKITEGGTVILLHRTKKKSQTDTQQEVCSCFVFELDLVSSLSDPNEEMSSSAWKQPWWVRECLSISYMLYNISKILYIYKVVVVFLGCPTVFDVINNIFLIFIYYFIFFISITFFPTVWFLQLFIFLYKEFYNNIPVLGISKSALENKVFCRRVCSNFVFVHENELTGKQALHCSHICCWSTAEISSHFKTYFCFFSFAPWPQECHCSALSTGAVWLNWGIKMSFSAELPSLRLYS